MQSKITYSESDFSFVNNSVSDIDFESDCVSDSNFSSVFMNLEICFSLFYICIPLNKPVDAFFSILITE